MTAAILSFPMREGDWSGVVGTRERCVALKGGIETTPRNAVSIVPALMYYEQPAGSNPASNPYSTMPMEYYNVMLWWVRLALAFTEQCMGGVR